MKVGFGGFFHGFSFGAGFELMRRVIVPAVLISVPLLLWWWLGPEKPKCDSERGQAARNAAYHVGERIRMERGDVRRAAVMHFVNDSTDGVTMAIRARLSDGGLLDLDGTPSIEKIRRVLNLRTRGVFDVDEAVKYGKKYGLDAVIIGSVDRFETVDGGAVLTGVVKMIRMSDGKVIEIPLDATKAEMNGGEIPATQPVKLMPLWRRVMYMAFVIIAIPILFFPFLKLVMRRDSNLATAATLIVLLAVDGLVIGIALGMRGTFGGLAVFLISLAIAFGYDLFMLSYAQLCRPAIPSAE